MKQLEAVVANVNDLQDGEMRVLFQLVKPMYCWCG